MSLKQDSVNRVILALCAILYFLWGFLYYRLENKYDSLRGQINFMRETLYAKVKFKKTDSAEHMLQSFHLINVNNGVEFILPCSGRFPSSFWPSITPGDTLEKGANSLNVLIKNKEKRVWINCDSFWWIEKARPYEGYVQ